MLRDKVRLIDKPRRKASLMSLPKLGQRNSSNQSISWRKLLNPWNGKMAWNLRIQTREQPSSPSENGVQSTKDEYLVGEGEDT
jgi:hypothetical protein